MKLSRRSIWNWKFRSLKPQEIKLNKTFSRLSETEPISTFDLLVISTTSSHPSRHSIPMHWIDEDLNRVILALPPHPLPPTQCDAKQAPISEKLSYRKNNTKRNRKFVNRKLIKFSHFPPLPPLVVVMCLTTLKPQTSKNKSKKKMESAEKWKEILKERRQRRTSLLMKTNVSPSFHLVFPFY